MTWIVSPATNGTMCAQWFLAALSHRSHFDIRGMRPESNTGGSNMPRSS